MPSAPGTFVEWKEGAVEGLAEFSGFMRPVSIPRFRTESQCSEVLAHTSQGAACVRLSQQSLRGFGLQAPGFHEGITRP